METHCHPLSKDDPHRLDRDDADILAVVRGGDPRQAATMLAVRYGKAVLRYALRLTRSRPIAEDVHQQVFLEAYRDLGTFAARSCLRVWLFGIARHRCMDAVISARRWNQRFTSEPATEPAIEPADDACAADHRIDRCRIQQILATCVTRLPPSSREAVVLRYQQGLSCEEAAAIAGVRAATLQQRVTRAIPQLRKYVAAALCSPQADRCG
jgi:RNA polymerase sigma factor (sigma-70 family)